MSFLLFFDVLISKFQTCVSNGNKICVFEIAILAIILEPRFGFVSIFLISRTIMPAVNIVFTEREGQTNGNDRTGSL